MTRTIPDVRKSGTLYVEARRRPGVDDGYGTNSVEAQVQEHLRRTYREVHIGQAVPLSPSLSTLVDRVEIKGHSKSHTFPDCSTYVLSESNIEVAAYTLHTDEDCGRQKTSANSDETPLPLHTSVLPHQNFDGYWEALIYKEPIGDQLLRVLSGAIRKFHNKPEDLLQNAWYNTALFCGPPGSGKTSLAQALAQQLAIRMSDLYPTTRLLQVDASAVFSHMYGGTAKEIASMFASVRQLASMDSDEVQLVVVLIDEVDKLVPCRKDVGKKNEPLDTMRATAEVLTGLDKLRKSVNIVWLFTTNLLDALDPAFVDRCRLKESIDSPATSCVYEMLRTEINAKIRRGEIVVDSLVFDRAHDAVSVTTPESSSDSAMHPNTEGASVIPTIEWANRNWPPATTTAVVVLQRIATLAAGLSGRNLRSLLDVALFTYWVDEQPSLRDALAALEAIVRKETGQTMGASHGCSDNMGEGELGHQAEADAGELPVGDTGYSRPVLPIDINVYSSDY